MKRRDVIKISKAVLILSTALFFTLVVFGNLTDYNSNYQFVQHVLSMDTTFEGNNLMWRAIDNPIIHHIFYSIIIIWEALIAIFLWIAGIKCLSKKKKTFEKGITKAIIGLTLALLLWFLAFITIGGEWFAMWQSQIWNGQGAAFRMFAINGLTLLYLFVKE
jgi:predicted small integral membrane protein